MSAFGFWLRRGFGLLALGFGATGLFGLGRTLLDAIRGGASMLALLPMLGIAMVFILPMLLVGWRWLKSGPVSLSTEPSVAADRAGWRGGLLVLALVAGLVVGGGYWF